MKLLDYKSYLLFGFLIFAIFVQLVIFGWTVGTIFLILLSILTGMHILIRYLHQKYKNKITKFLTILFRTGLLVTGILCLAILTLVAIPQISCQTLNPEKIEQADYMIVLGAGLKNGHEISYNLKSRLDKAREVSILRPDLTIILSGGKGHDETISESEAMRKYLVENGVSEKSIITENKSHSTYENLAFTKEKIGKNLDQGLLITQDFHIFRSQYIAHSLDLKTSAICSRTPFPLKTNYMIREIPAVINEALGNILK